MWSVDSDPDGAREQQILDSTTGHQRPVEKVPEGQVSTQKASRAKKRARAQMATKRLQNSADWRFSLLFPEAALGLALLCVDSRKHYRPASPVLHSQLRSALIPGSPSKLPGPLQPHRSSPLTPIPMEPALVSRSDRFETTQRDCQNLDHGDRPWAKSKCQQSHP